MIKIALWATWYKTKDLQNSSSLQHSVSMPCRQYLYLNDCNNLF